jgi:hypothetical protein
MNVTLSIDEQLVERARRRAEALGKSLNQMIREYLQKFVGDEDVDRDMEELIRLSGKGNSRGWKFNRDELHERS